MNYYEINITINGSEEKIESSFLVEAISFDKAVEKIEKDLNICLK